MHNIIPSSRTRPIYFPCLHGTIKMGPIFRKGWYRLVFLGMLIFVASCVQNNYALYESDLRQDDGMTEPFRIAAKTIARANDIDVSDMKFWITDDETYPVGILHNKDIIIGSYIYLVTMHKPRVIFAVMAHELAHKKLGHEILSKEKEFEADREAVKMLRNIGMYNKKEDYISMLNICRRLMDNDGSGINHPSIAERIKKIEQLK